MEKSRTTIEAVLCRLEAKELEQVADKFTNLHDAMLEGMKVQFYMTNGQLVAAKKPTLTLREYGAILTRVGLMAMAAAEDEAEEDQE